MVRRRVIALAVALAVAVAGSIAHSRSRQPPRRTAEAQQARAAGDRTAGQADRRRDGRPAGTERHPDDAVAVLPEVAGAADVRAVRADRDRRAGGRRRDVRARRQPLGAARPQKTKKVEYPWDDIHFLPAAQVAGANGRLNRVFMATPGTYDVYVAMKERLPEKAPKGAVAKIGVLKTQVTVPDFWNGELTTSSVIVTDKVNILTAAPSPEEARERPFVFGAQELIPAADPIFLKSEQLATFFQVYNASLDSAGKPNLVMEYNFHRKEGGAEKFFNKTNPQTINASNLPPTFDPAKFPVPGGIEVPLKTFPEGEYRLEIKITDKNTKRP